MDKTLAHKSLIVSTWAPPMIGGAQFLANLLREYDSSSYVILTNSEDAVYSDIPRTGSSLMGKYIDLATPSQNTYKSFTKSTSGSLKHFVIRRLRWPIAVNFFKALYCAWSIKDIFRFYRAGRRAILDDNLKIIISLSDYGPAMLAGYWLSRTMKLPYIIYLFDLYRDNCKLPIYSNLASWFELKMLRHAKTIIVPNNGTSNYLRKRYSENFSFTKVANVIPKRPFPSKEPNSPPFTIVYTGNIYWAQEKSILDLLQALKYLNNKNVFFNIFAPTITAAIEKSVKNTSNVKLGSAPPSAMPEIQSKANLLFLPLSWETESPAIIQTATPGKFSDYLGSKRAILIYAPKYAYICTYAREHDCAIVVDTPNYKVLAQRIEIVMNNYSLRSRYATNAFNTYINDFSFEKNLGRFSSAILLAGS